MTRRTFLLLLLSLIGSLFLPGCPTKAKYKEEVEGLEFPLDFPIAFSSPTELYAQPSSTSILSLRSLSFWERLFNLK